jgi:hypothetical protein
MWLDLFFFFFFFFFFQTKKPQKSTCPPVVVCRGLDKVIDESFLARELLQACDAKPSSLSPFQGF